MPNSIQLAEKFLPILDAVYAKDSVSAILDTPSTKLNFTGANKVSVYKTEVEGLIDYDRNTGYGAAASVTGSWEDFTLAIDRGIEMSIDRMDNEETMNMAVAAAIGETTRLEIVPEVDAYRFAKYASLAGTKVTGAISDAIGAIDTAIGVMDDAEVTKEGRILFVANSVYRLIKAGCTRTIMNGETDISKEVLIYEDMIVKTVPTKRFKKTVTLNDGTSSRGFTPGSVDINFMIVDPKAIIQVKKFANAKMFTPDINQEMDATKYQARLYHDAFVLGNKTKGIYVHTVS